MVYAQQIPSNFPYTTDDAAAGSRATYRFRLGKLKITGFAPKDRPPAPPRRWRGRMGSRLPGFALGRDEKGSAGNGPLLLYRSTDG